MRRPARIRRRSAWLEALEPRRMFAGPGDDGADTRAAAQSLPFAYGTPGSFAEEIGRPEDVDLLALSLQAGDKVELSLASTSTGEFPFFGVLRAFGETSAVDASVEQQLTFTAAAGGTFHIGVSGFGNDQYDPDQYNETLFGFTGSYRLDYTITGQAPQENPGDPPTGGNPQTPGGTEPPTDAPTETSLPSVPPAPRLADEEFASGQLGSAGEVDRQSLTVATASWLDVRAIDAAGNPVNVTLTLTDSAGTALATSPAGAARLTQHLAPGNYSIEVQTHDAPVDYRLGTRLIAAAAPLDTFLTSDGISALATGDFTGDGIVDSVIANELESTLTFLIGLGDGTFAPQTPYTLENAPTDLLAADLTGDGRLDLVVAHRDGERLSILESAASGWFGVVRGLAVGANVRDLTADDFDADGAMDLAASLGGTPSIVIVANLRGTTPTTRTIPLAGEAVAITGGDFNGDGRQDLAAALRATNQAAVLEQAADGTFGIQWMSVSGEPSDVAAGDFDADGALDLAVGLATDGNVALLRRDANDAYAVTPITVDVDRAAASAGSAFETVLRAADFSGDGTIDLAVANTFARDVTVLLGGAEHPLASANQVLAANSIVALDAADLNGDVRVDLVVANNDAEQSGVMVKLGRGDGSFQQVTRLTVGVDPQAMVSADFDSDGRLDLVSSSYAGLALQLGTGDGAFAPPLRIAAEQPHALVSGDFNRDGRPDLAATLPFDGLNVDARIAVWLGLGDGTFRDASFFTVGELPLDIAAADFNGDGALDLATANNSANSVSVLLGTGDGSFNSGVTLAAGSAPSAVVAVDISGDGIVDLAAANEASDNLSLFLGLGNGQFATSTSVAVGDAPLDLAVADLDGDGRVDLASANHNAGTLTVLFQELDGTFTAFTSQVGEGPRGLAVLPDSSRMAVTLDAQDRVVVLERSGNRQFVQVADLATGRTPISVVASDLNQDGRADLATLNAFTNDISVLLAAADGSYFPRASQQDAVTDAAPRFVDLNGDGLLDALVVRQSGEVLLRFARVGGDGLFDAPITVNAGRPALAATTITTSEGTLIAALDREASQVSIFRADANDATLVNEIPLAGTPVRLTSGDINGDGLDDLAVADARSGQVTLLVAASDGNWSARALSSGAGAISQLSLVDADGQGNADLVLTDSARGDVRLFLNGGAGQFAAPLVYRAGLGPYQFDAIAQHSWEATAGFSFGDFDGDALPDLLLLNPGSNTLAILVGAGADGLSAPRFLFTADRPSAAAVGDFNRDGKADFAVLLAGDETIAIYLGDGQGGFTEGATYSAGNLPRGIAALDVDRDGLLDLVIGNAFGDLLTFRGNGDGTFGNFLRAGSDAPLAVADLNGDGIPEVVVANASLDSLSVQQAIGEVPTEGALTATEIFAQQRAQGLLAPGAVEMADLNADGRADMIVANRGGNEVLIYLGNGDGTFAAPRGFHAGTNPSGITLHDVNGDGRLDLVIANAGSNDVSVLVGDAAELFVPGPRLAVGSAPVSTLAGDYNNDGLADLLVANSGADNASLLFGVGGGFFNDQQPLLFPTGADPRSLLVGQFDGRAGADLVSVNAGSGTLTFYSNFLSGTLSASTLATGGLRPSSAVAQDFNSDGRLDLVVANNASGSLSIVLGADGGLSLGGVLGELGFEHPSSLELVDFGGETGLRLLVSHEGDEQPHLFTPKDFLPREGNPSVSPLGPGSGLLLTFLQAGVRVLASSIVTLPALPPGVAHFLQAFLGGEANEVTTENADLAPTSNTLLNRLQLVAGAVLESFDVTLDAAVAAWNIVTRTDTSKTDWLAGAGEMLAWLTGQQPPPADQGASLALTSIAKAVVNKLDVQAADAALAEMESFEPDAPEFVEDDAAPPRELPNEPAQPMPAPKIDAPITPAALEQPIVEEPLEVEPAAKHEAPATTVAWPWRYWAAAMALGLATLGGGGYAARLHWRRRTIETLGEA